MRAGLWQARKPARELNEDEALAAYRAGTGVLWIHLRASDQTSAAAFLIEKLALPALAVENTLVNAQHTSLTQQEDLISFQVPAGVYGDRHLTFQSVGFFMGKSSLLTVSVGEAPVDWLFARWLAKKDRKVVPAYLLHSCVDACVDTFFPLLDKVQDAIEKYETSIYRAKKTQQADLIRIKRHLMEVRRRVIPVREAMNTLLRRDVDLIPAESRPYFQDVYDHTLRVIDSVDVNRDILSTIMDAQLNIISNRLNEVMRFMTALGTILMSAGLIASTYGMNFRHMPELQWRYGYPFTLGLMALTSGIWVWFFRRRGWL